MYRILVTWTVIITCFTASAVGQSLVLTDSPIEERTVGGGGQDELISLAVNWRGDIATVGNSARGDHGGQDICFVAFDMQLNKIVERNIGRKNEDGAGQIAVLPDGRYIVAGYSTRPSGQSKIRANYFGKRDGWVLILDEQGETEREILLGTAADDAFVSVAVCPDGSVWLAGNSGEEVWIVRLDADFSVLWEKRVRYHQLLTHANMAALSSEGEFFVIGGVEEMGRKHLWVSGFDADGQTVMEKIYPSSQAEKGTGIVALDNNRLAIVGAVEHPKDRENGFVSIMDNRGVIKHYQALGGREFDQVNAITQLHNGHIAVGGGSASFERGSRRISAWLSVLSDSTKLHQEQYYGSKLDDEAVALLQHPDGRLFAIGTTARQILKMRQGWLFQIGKAEKEKAPIGTLIPKIGKGLYPLEQGDFVDKRSIIPFSMENRGKSGQFNLRAMVEPLDSSLRGILRLPLANQTIWLPDVAAGQTLAWGLPLRFDQKASPGLYRFSVQFYQGKTKLGAPQIFEVSLGEHKHPQLELSIVHPEQGFVVGQEGFLLVEVRNSGTQSANGLTLNTVAPEGVRVPSQVGLGELGAGGKILYKLPVQIGNASISPDYLGLKLRVADESLNYTASTETKLNMVAVGPPANSTDKPQYTVAVWVYPNPDNFDRSEIIWNQEEITVQIKIVSNQAITKQQFCLEINGQPCQTGAKFEEIQIKGDKNSKTFSQTVRLGLGENLLQASVQQPNGKVSSEPLKIIYSPAKPNLHILSIGVPAADLKYTSKDARDFANALSSQENQAFGKIFLDTLLTEAQTTKTEILKSLRRLQYRYADLQILPKDLLVIFVSGHGLGAYDGSFRLAASDYDSPFLQETSLDFEQEIVNYLQRLPCVKLFFVDACHSGTTSGTGLAGIATRKNELNMLVSCQSDEYSYEDDHWQNGAFTRALVRCIQDFAAASSAVDQNKDSVLDLDELFGYIQTEVPNLVEKKRPKVKTSQRPKLILADPGRRLSLFELKKG